MPENKENDENVDLRAEAKEKAVEETDDHTAVDGYVGTHFSYEHASNETEEPRYSSDKEKDFYDRFAESVSEPASPFDNDTTLNDFKAREAELAESTNAKEEEPGELKPGTKAPGKERPSLTTPSKG